MQVLVDLNLIANTSFCGEPFPNLLCMLAYHTGEINELTSTPTLHANRCKSQTAYKCSEPKSPTSCVVCILHIAVGYKRPAVHTLLHSSPSRLLRSCKYKLEKDLKDKSTALSIDGTCAALTDRDPAIGYSQETVKIQTE